MPYLETRFYWVSFFKKMQPTITMIKMKRQLRHLPEKDNLATEIVRKLFSNKITESRGKSLSQFFNQYFLFMRLKNAADPHDSMDVDKAWEKVISGASRINDPES